jgi:hypothetical protein
MVMKKAVLLFLVFVISPIMVLAQSMLEVDYISPYKEGVAAIKKGDQWGFIDVHGDIVVSFRDDLIPMETDMGAYPAFNDGRCLFKEKRDGITYYGYIDQTGSQVIEAQFLNARHFNDKYAVALQLVEKTGGSNNVLRKPVITHVYFEVVIDTNGEILHYLTYEPQHITLDEKFLKQPIPIISRMISDKAYATFTKNKKWVIKKIDQIY